MEIIKVENLSFAYQDSKVKILRDINFSVRKGEFVILYGPSGCGKTTLLKLMKKELRPEGKTKGSIYYKDMDIQKIGTKRSASEIGFVMQNPDSQIVTDKVYHELAFGLENLGEPSETIKLRTAEISSVFGINKWFESDTSKLSGGQKQLLNLASAMITSPELLLLDEPISQLDPFSASTFVNMLLKLNREYGVTVIIAEHNLESIFAMADTIAVIDKNTIRYLGIPRTCCGFFSKEASIVQGMPVPARIYNRFKIRAACPIDIREAKEFLYKYCPDNIKKLKKPKYSNKNSYAVELEKIYFRYDRKSDDVIKNLNMNVKRGEIYAIVGGNGSGKTTLLSIIARHLKPYAGKILVGGVRNIANIGMIPQNPLTLFSEETLKDDLINFALSCGVNKDIAPNAVYDICRNLNMIDVLKNHPYDLSGGEVQKAAIAKILISNPDVILLDEPTKGVDAWAKTMLADTLKRLANEGKTIIIVTHDNDFAAETADICGLLFNGKIVSEDEANQFYSQNDFYTTSSARISKGFFKNAVTYDDIIDLCKENGGVV